MERYTKKEKLEIMVSNARAEQDHVHQDIELIYIMEGSMDIYEGENKNHLEAEDILVINANKRHHFSASEDILFVSLMISYELVSDVFKSVDIIFWCNSTKDDSERFHELRSAIRQLLSHYLNHHGEVDNFGHIALCYRIMDILSIHFLVRSFDKEQMSEQDKYEHRMLQINNYVRSNYNQNISLKELADKLYLSNGYLSRFFKKHFGMNFARYLTNVRLYHAADELLYTNTSITRIASDNGFTNVAVFNKEFKQVYGTTPSAMRKQAREERQAAEPAPDQEEIERRLEQYLREDDQERPEVPVTDCVDAGHDVTVRTKLDQVWRKMINAGPAEDLLRSEVREHILVLKESLKFEYIRFWNIFSEAMLIDINSEEYNFSRLDSILDYLVQLGLRPHIDLGQKPRRVQKSVHSALIYQEQAAEFEDIGHWNRVVNALIRHLAHRYGRTEIGTWRLEIWYDEQFVPGEAYMERYFQQFSHAYDIVRKYSDSMEVGGCGFRMHGDIGFTIDFLKRWKSSGRLPDYIAILSYAYERGEENQDIYSKRSTDPSHLLHVVRKMKGILKHVGLEDLKLYVTEWNITISDRNYINDTCFKGAYILKNILDVHGEADLLGYFSGSDRISEFYDSNALLHGGMGLIAKDTILKPAGFAFEFLNRLYPYCVGQGENYLVSTDGHHTYGIICHNYKKLNYNYYFSKEDEIEKGSIWKYFEDRDTLRIKLTLRQMAAGHYQMKIYRINERSGSVLDIWREMNFDKELSREDIKYFRRVCEPKLTMDHFQVEDNNCTVNLQLSANEIMFVRLSKTEA